MENGLRPMGAHNLKGLFPQSFKEIINLVDKSMNNDKVVIIFGGSGTLGSELKQIMRQRGFKTVTPSHSEVDITDYRAVYEFLQQYRDSNIVSVINCAAVVNTIGIETTFNIRNQSFYVNTIAVKNIAKICKEFEWHFVHVSTDYVFSEMSTDGNEFPINIYGYHKLISELYIQNIEGLKYSIVRVGWIYGQHTHRTFIHKFLSNVINHINEGKLTVECVSDQISTPTSVDFISEKICEIVDSKRFGVFSISPKEVATKYEFAKEILRICIEEYGITEFKNVELAQSSTNQNSIAYPLTSAFQIKDLQHWLPVDITWKEDLLAYMQKYKYEFYEYIKEIMCTHTIK